LEFEARYRRFLSIRDVSILNERAFSIFRIKHLLYIFLSIIFLQKGLWGSPANLAAGAFSAIWGVASAMLSDGSMSLEGKALSLAINAVLSIREGRRMKIIEDRA